MPINALLASGFAVVASAVTADQIVTDLTNLADRFDTLQAQADGISATSYVTGLLGTGSVPVRYKSPPLHAFMEADKCPGSQCWYQ